jgi:hypothetical protein
MSRDALLDWVGSRQTIWREEDGVVRLESRQDVSHIVEAAKILADEPPGKDFRHVALIPETVLNRSMIEGWFNDKQAWKKWANDPANREYRTWRGRL